MKTLYGMIIKRADILNNIDSIISHGVLLRKDYDRLKKLSTQLNSINLEIETYTSDSKQDNG